MWGVQFGRWKGANVTGTASTGNVEFVKSLGAQTVVDYTKAKVESAVKGMDVVRRIEKVPTGSGPPPHQNVPTRPVVIESARVVEGKPAAQ